MKLKLCIILAFVAVSSFAQNPKVDLEKFKNKKKLVSEETSEVTVEIRKPNNAMMVARKRTNLRFNTKINIRERLIKSNKLLY